MPADWLRPDWPANRAAALMTTRRGGFSAPPFDSMNLRFGVGDDAASVARNRQRLADALAAEAGTPLRLGWLTQVHGTGVARLRSSDAACVAPEADAAITTDHGIACTVQVADCLPVLFAAPGGVGAAHAGWRGLAAGVLEATLAALSRAAGCAPADVAVWLGPCIGAGHFEVGADVLAAFGAEVPGSIAASAFVRRAAGEHASSTERKWLADLPLLAIQRLRASGVTAISGGSWCTVADASRFFSYRRDHVTGRMVAAVWRQGSV